VLAAGIQYGKAWEKHLAQHPEAEKLEGVFYIKFAMARPPELE